MIKKVGILTFHAAHNVGSMLQAYALLTYLKSVGIDAEDINLRIPAQKRMYNNPLFHWGPKSLKARLNKPLLDFHNIQRWFKFEKFLNDYLHHSGKEYDSWESLSNDIPKLGYSAIICGGDQIWNSNCLDFSESYYLPSKLADVKKISYSPSFGGKNPNSLDLQRQLFIKKHLTDFDILSVRDYVGQRFLEGLLGRSVPVMPDPTLLLAPDEWDAIIPKERIIEGDYVLYYSPFSSKAKEDLALRIGQMVNAPVISTNAGYYTNKKITEYNNCGPLQFLNILKYAKFVCGYSYHLAVFSIILHKHFWAFGGDTDARIVGLLSAFGLEKQGIALDTIEISQGSIDFTRTDEVLCLMREQGKSFIKSSLE